MSERWPRVRLGEVLRRSTEITAISSDAEYQEITVKLWGKGVVRRGIVSGASLAGSRRFVAKAGQFIASRIDARNGALGIVPPELCGAVVTNDFPLFELDRLRIEPGFLEWLSRTADFVELCRRASEGTTNRVRLKEERFLDLETLLPPLEEQRRIVARIEELAAKVEEARGLRHVTIEAVEALAPSYLTTLLGSSGTTGTLSDALEAKPRNGWSARCDNLESGIPVLTLAAVTGFRYNGSAYKRTSEATNPEAHYWLQPGDLLITRSNTPDLGACPSNVARVRARR